MSSEVATIIRFQGDPDQLGERLARARELWNGTRDSDISPPILHAVLRSEDGIVVISGYANAAAAHAFNRGLGRCMTQAGLRPTGHERFQVEQFGWE